MTLEQFDGLRGVAENQDPTTLKTPETLVETKIFSQEQIEALGKQGFVIYLLTGQSIKDLRGIGEFWPRWFWSRWLKKLPDFQFLGSMHSEVAIKPSKLFLPKSNNKTLVQQEEMVEKFSQELGKKVKGVKAIIGQAPDYEELAFAHFFRTREYLFGANVNYDAARTKTPTDGSFVALVGHFYADDGITVVSGWHRDFGGRRVHAAPLVVPV